MGICLQNNAPMQVTTKIGADGTKYFEFEGEKYYAEPKK